MATSVTITSTQLKHLNKKRKIEKEPRPLPNIENNYLRNHWIYIYFMAKI